MIVRRVGVAAALLLGSACQSDNQTAKLAPGPVSVPEAPTTSTTVSEPTTTTTAATDLIESPSPLITSPEPILCSGYLHPLHHLPCNEANDLTAARETPSYAESPPPTARRPATVQPTSKWAIPDYIVACESGGSWEAENPSGAAGPYQLMPEHFGGVSALNQSQEAQHAKAAELWDGGRGASHWEQCL